MRNSQSIQRTSGEIADLVGGELIGPSDIIVSGVATLKHATATDLAFLGNPIYKNQVLSSAAAVVLVPMDFLAPPPERRAWVKCQDPSGALIAVTSLFAPPPRVPTPGIHPTAVIAVSATVPKTAHVGAHTVIEDDVSIGDHAIIEAGCYIGYETTVGDGCRFYPRVTVRERCQIGNRVVIHSGTVIGSDGFGYIPGSQGHKKIPQLGIVQIDDDVEIGANVAIDRARFDRTWIKKGSKIDNLVQIAHNVVIGEHVFVVAQVGISGSVEIGDRAIIAGQVGIAGHIAIGDGATIMGKAGVVEDVAPGATLMGYPAVARGEFWRQQALMQKLPELRKRILKMERDLEILRQSCTINSGTA